MPEAVTVPASAATGSEGQGMHRLLRIASVALLMLGWLLPWFVQPTSSGIGFSPQDVVVSNPTGIGTVLMYVLGVCVLILILLPALDLTAALDAARRTRRRLGWRWLGAYFAGGVVLGVVWLLVHSVALPIDTTGARALQGAVLDGLTFLGALGGLFGLGVPLVLVLSAGLAPVQRRLETTAGRWLDRIRLSAALLGIVITLVVWLLARVIQEEPLFGRVDDHTITNSAVWLMIYGCGVAAAAYGARRWILTHSNRAFAVVAFPFAALLPLLFHQAPDFIFWAAAFFAVYTLLALGLNVVVGFAGLLDLGYAAFFAIGAYTCASLASPYHHLHFPLWVLIFIGATVASFFGAVLGAPTLRLRGDYLAIVTLGFGEIIPDLATNNIFNLTGGPNGISNIDKPQYGPIDFAANLQWYYWALLILVVGSIVMLRNLERSRVGRAWVALREDEVAAAATGINTTTTKLLAFAIGASVSGFAGAFYGSMVGIVSPDDFSFSVSVSVLSAVVLGGIGNIAGVVLGGFVLTFVIFWVLQHLNDWMGTLAVTVQQPSLANVDLTKYTFIIYGIALIAMMLLRPGGLLPSRARSVEIQSGGESESLAAVQGRA